jgi:carbon monoxide dehydrogenase subunit G
MEVSLDKRYPLGVSVEQAWTVLRDIRATAGCMPGASITEQLDDTHFKGAVKSKVGPAVMTFGGDIEVLGLDEAARQLRMMGKGSDKGGSTASMDLTAHLEAGDSPAACVLVGHAAIVVNGKLAQFGSRLLVPVADMMLAQFAANFEVAAATVAANVPDVPAAPAAAGTVAAAPAPRPMPAPVKELNVLAFGWAVIKAWFGGLFSGKRA